MNGTKKTQSFLINRRLAIIVACGTILLSGVVHGRLSGRWVERQDFGEIAQRMNELPQKCGNWELVRSQEISDSAKNILQCYGSSAGFYRNIKTDEEVGVFLLLGPRGPTAVHRPEICFNSIGTIPDGERVKVSLPNSNSSDEFWSTKFRLPAVNEPHLEAWYAFSTGGPWVAAENPRFWMIDRLFKIQVSGRPASSGESVSPIADFMENFVPAIRPTLTSSIN